MRSARMWGIGMLFVAPMMGCGESLSPPARGTGGGRDLAFVLPAAKTVAAVINTTAGDPPARTANTAMEAALTETTKGQALILSKYATAHFSGVTLNYEFGFVGFGTGYEIDPKLTIRFSDGRSEMKLHDQKIVEFVTKVPLMMRPAFQRHVRLEKECGATANLAVAFTVWLETGLWRSQAYQGESASANQAACAAPGAGGDGGGGTGGDGDRRSGLLLCKWDVWLDADGNIIEVLFLGCTPIAM